MKQPVTPVPIAATITLATTRKRKGAEEGKTAYAANAHELYTNIGGEPRTLHQPMMPPETKL